MLEFPTIMICGCADQNPKAQDRLRGFVLNGKINNTARTGQSAPLMLEEYPRDADFHVFDCAGLIGSTRSAAKRYVGPPYT